MAEGGPHVLLLAGRLKDGDDGRSVLALVERLGTVGVSAQVLCASALAGDDRVIGRAGLGHRWLLPLTVRGLRPGQGGLIRPDLLHVLTPGAGALGIAAADCWRIPYVQTVDEFLTPGERLRVSRRWCRSLIAASYDLAEDLERVWGVSAGFLTVVRPGIPVPGEEHPPPVQHRVPVIGTAGPLKDTSGFATFLNAARRVLDGGVDAEFVIAGQGDDEVDLRRRADRLRIADRVTFAAQPAVGPRFWGLLDLYNQPATAPTVGRSLANALAFGVPSVASDVQGLRALMTHGETGLLVPPENSGALAEAILALLADPERARILGNRGRDRIRRDFDPDAEAANLASIYRRFSGGGCAVAVRASHVGGATC
jgi:glycosyltransferase involved in cell wall biosynthesis